jgi:hypothetical protein
MTRPELLEEIRRLRQSQQPILCGPWLGEIGFELLYWVPFLRWMCQTANILPDRVWILSRGGGRSWYADFAGHYVEAYDFFTVAELRTLNQARVTEQAKRGRQFGLRRHQVTAKQFGLMEAESSLLGHARRSIGQSEPYLIHPSLMYRLFRPFWRPPKMDLFRKWATVTRLQRLTIEDRTPTERLPPTYIAVKAYSSEACRISAKSAESMRRLIRTLQRKAPVVLLETGHAYDEHGEFSAPDCIVPAFDPATNLAQQTAIISGATEFVSTYGGFAYLGPLVGVPTLGVYTDANFRRDHLQLMKMVSHRMLHVDFRIASLEMAAGAIRAAA